MVTGGIMEEGWPCPITVSIWHRNHDRHDMRGRRYGRPVRLDGAGALEPACEGMSRGAVYDTCSFQV